MEKIIKETEKYRELILAAERYIWNNPETGFREIKTTKYMKEQFEKLGYSVTCPEDITGFWTVIDTKREGPTVLVLGELDSVICKDHPDADKETGAVHACGHNAQCAALLGIAAVLKNEEILNELSGKIMLCAIPAEELIENDFRKELVKKGITHHLGGKQEYIHRGYFDEVDLAIMVHAGDAFHTSQGSTGFINKKVVYKGKAAHAGSCPWDGTNALYAATQGISAANAVRETFPEKDLIRFHPIITHGGDIVNAIPAEVKLEAYVRGKTFDAIVSANKRINKALCGAALSLGAGIEIEDEIGYGPLVNDRNMMLISKKAADLVIPEENYFIAEGVGTGSTDMGDISQLFPSVHPYSCGETGNAHGKDYAIADPEKACVKSAKLQLGIIKLLLENGACEGKRIVSEFKPRFSSKEEYFEYLNKINSTGERIRYTENGAIVEI